MKNDRVLVGPPCSESSPAKRSGEAGFTLIEMLVSLAVFLVVILGVLALFDSNTRLARTQGRVADMQQSLRFAQYDMVRRIRMAARGGLPAMLAANGAYPGRLLPAGLAIEVSNNAPASTRIGSSASAAVLPGTDVVTIRGVFSTIYQSNPVPAGNFTLQDSNGDGTPEKGALILYKTSPTGVPQNLTPLADAVDTTRGGHPEALLLVSPLDDSTFAVVELDPTSTYSKTGSVVEQVRLAFNVTGAAHSSEYLALSPGGNYPPAMKTVAFAGLLEEHKFYIREVHAVANDPASELMPRLARARVYPGTNTAWKDDPANLVVDVASNIMDLQATLGIDTNGDGVAREGTDASSKRTDEWLFNQSGDPTDSATWNGTAALPPRLLFLRLNTLARTERRDANQFQRQTFGIIEDKDYSSVAYSKYNSTTERKYRSQQLQTLIDLRNLS